MSTFDALLQLCDRFDEIRASLRWAKSARTESEAEQRAAREVNAASFVAAAGALEQFFRRFVESLAAEVVARGNPLSQVRLSIHAVVSSDDFRSLQTVKDRDKMFKRRMQLLERTGSVDPCTINIRHDELGIDGETLRPSHVDLIWALFGLPAPAFPDVAQQVALRVFADNRNDYAHGKVPVDQFLQNPECDIDRIIGRIGALEDWCFHCWDVSESYFSKNGFSR